MIPERFHTSLDRYGATLELWPESERREAERLLAHSPAAVAELARARRLERALALADAALPDPEAPERLNALMDRISAQARLRPQTPTPAPSVSQAQAPSWARRGLPGWLRRLHQEWLPSPLVAGYALPAMAAMVIGVYVGSVTPALFGTTASRETVADNLGATYPVSLFTVQSLEGTVIQ